MTIAGRHYFLIAFVIILAATLSGFGIYQTRTVFASANYSNENIIPGLQILADTQAGLAAISGAMWSHLAVATPSQKQAFADQIHERRLQLIVGFQKYNTQ
ncbi:MAG: MCP four helix bundle domain-containing protein [Sphingomonadaceae bacterium]